MYRTRYEVLSVVATWKILNVWTATLSPCKLPQCKVASISRGTGFQSLLHRVARGWDQRRRNGANVGDLKKWYYLISLYCFFTSAIFKLYIYIPTNCTQLLNFINNTLKHVLSKTLNFSYMFRSLSDHPQWDTIFVLTSVTKITDVAACLLQCVCWVLSCPVIAIAVSPTPNPTTGKKNVTSRANRKHRMWESNFYY